MSSPHFPPWKHDVFLSPGERDVKMDFILELFKRLHQVRIGHFEEDKIEGAEINKANRLDAIPQPTFAFALIVFSREYFDSSPGLKELVEILYCQKDPKLVVIPIFYMDREDVPNLASNDKFKKALRSRKKTDIDAQEKWSALATAGYELKAAKGYVPVTPCRNLVP